MVYIDIFVSKIQFMYLVFGCFSFLSVSVFNFPYSPFYSPFYSSFYSPFYSPFSTTRKMEKDQI